MNFLGLPLSSSSGSSVDWLNVDSDIVPISDGIYDVGRSTKRFRNGEYVNLIADNVNSTVLNTDSVTSTSVVSNSFVKPGGTGTQFLMADGTVSNGSQSGQNIYPYVFSTSIAGIPASQHLRVNNAIMSSASEVVISHIDSDGIDVDIFLGLIDATSILYLQDLSNSANYIRYAVTASVVVPNSHTTCTVVYQTAEGTGLTNFPNNHDIFMSVFVNGTSIDLRLSSLENKTFNQSRSLTVTNIANTLSCTGNFAADIIDSVAGTLFLGTNATADVEIGKIGSSTTFYSSIIGNTLDAPPSTILSIGYTNAGSVRIGNASSIITMNGPSLNATTRITTPSLDTLTIGALNIGATNTNFINIGNATSAINLLNNVYCNSYDARVSTALNIGGVLCNAVNIGKSGVITTITGTSLNVGTRTNCDQFERSTAGALRLGTDGLTCTSITLGNGSITTNLNGNMFATGIFRSTNYDSTTTTGLGISTATSVSVGRVASPTTVTGSSILENTVPYVNSLTGPRLHMTRWIMTPVFINVAVSQALTTTGLGAVAFDISNVFNSFTVGTTLRFKFCGVFASMSAGATFGISLTHFYGTQTLFTITFASATSASPFNGEVNFYLISLGNNRNPAVAGYVNYTDGAVMKTQAVQLTSWLPNLFDTTLANSMAMQTVISGTVSYAVNFFTIEQLR